MTDTNSVISIINRYQYNLRKEAINKLTKLDTRDFIGKEYEILKSLLKGKKKDDKVVKKIKKAIFGNENESFGFSNYANNFLEEIKQLNRASMAYDKFLVNLNCKYHVFYSGQDIEAKDIKAYEHKPPNIDKDSNYVILDRHNTHARIINYSSDEVKYIDIPRRNFALSPDKLLSGSKYTFNDTVNDVHEMICDNVPWLCNGLYHSIKNVEDSDKLNIVVPIINISYKKSIDISKKMVELLKDGLVKPNWLELSKKGEIIDDYSEFSIHNDCIVCIMEYNNKKITIIGLSLFDRINYIHSLFKDISDDYNIFVKFIDDDTFNKIKDNYTKFPTFVYKMYCLNYAVKHYSNYHTTIIDLYYATKLVFFSCFNNCFKGNIDKKNITELTDNQINVAKDILKHYLDNDFVFTVHVDNSNQDWLNLDNLNKLDPDNYKTSTGDIKIPNFVIDSEQYKLEDVISKFLEEIRDEIIHLYATHNNFKNMMINDIIKNESIPKPDSIPDTIDTIKQIIGENTEKLVCIPVFCINRHTSSVNYDLMESIINSINKKIKEKADVKEDLLQLNFT
jgi:hypothetical protein